MRLFWTTTTTAKMHGVRSVGNDRLGTERMAYFRWTQREWFLWGLIPIWSRRENEKEHPLYDLIRQI